MTKKRSNIDRVMAMFVVFCMLFAGSAVVTADLLEVVGLIKDTQEYVLVPDVEDTESDFSYSQKSTVSTELQGEAIALPEFENSHTTSVSTDLQDGSFIQSDQNSQITPGTRGKPEEKGNKLGNAPDALYRVLQKFLSKGKAIPPNFPVPYKIYTNSSGVEKFTDCLTKMPMQINVDNNKTTGKGDGKDIGVKLTISTNPLEMELYVERLSGTPAPDLDVYISFPAFFYNGEAGDPEGDPYWLFGYETLPSHAIPGDITMTFSVNQSLGSSHVFDFDWNSSSGIEPLRFRFGTFQVIDQNTTNPIKPAFASFEVSSPSFAGLTFETIETDTTTTKCMHWSAPTSFYLSFNFSEVESYLGLDYDFPMTITVDKVPQSFSICTTEDRAANTYSVDYTASSTVDLLQMETRIDVTDLPIVDIDLRIEDMPAEMHVLLGDGSLSVDVDSNVGLLAVDASADLGFAGIESMVNARLRVYDIPDFNATWYTDDTGNGFALDALTCVGSIELAFSFGDLVFPLEHDGDPDSHYLFAWSDTEKTAIALRILGVSHIGFDQNNADQSNTLSLVLCDNNVFYVIAHTEVGSLLTPGKDVDLRIVMDETPTEITIVWTVPFTLSITTNDAISSIVADLTVDATGPPAEDLTAHAEILSIPANMAWTIDPDGSITFTATGSIGTVLLEATDPNGLPGTDSFFDTDPIRLLYINSHSIPSFTATWSSDDVAPQTAVAFNTAPSTSLGDLTFGISTSITSFATFSTTEDNRGMIYNDDSLNLGNGQVMEGSIWLDVVEISRVELNFGGSNPTYDLGFGSSASHNLKTVARFDRTSIFNPGAADEDVAIHIVTSTLPTSMDLVIIPEESFDYDAQGIDIAHVDINAYIGDLSPGVHDPLDLNEFQVDIYDIPGTAAGQWSFSGDTGTVNIQLEEDSELGSVELIADNEVGVLGSDFVHVEASIESLPEDVDVTWDMGAKSGSISFSEVGFTGGLGEAFILATTMDETDTTAYINSLDIDPNVSMTTYSDYESTIDSNYWPGTGAEDNLEATYRRNPELNTAADDYIVYRSGGSETVFTARIREIHLVEISMGNTVGYAEIQFTPGVTTDRQLYLRSEDTDPADDDLILAELSELPNTAGDNFFRVDYDRSLNEYSFETTEVIDFIDVYIGTRESTSQTKTFYKVLLADLPQTAELSFDLDDTSTGFLEFAISSNFEMGVVIQQNNGRYAGWMELTGIRFDYEFYGPGELSSSYDIGYYICHIDIDIHTLPWPGTNTINGIFGIYVLKNNPESLVGESVTTPSAAYIPEWTFILDDFKQFAVYVDWDVGISISASPPELDIGLFPSVSITLDFSIMLDYWWNSAHKIDLGTIAVVPFPPPYAYIEGEITLNSVADYRENAPIHILPVKTLDVVTMDLDDDDWEFHLAHIDPPELSHWHIPLTLTIEVPGTHTFSDHNNPFS